MLLPPRLPPLAHTLSSAHTYAVLYDSVVPKLPTLIQATNNLKLANERQSFQANKRRNQPSRWKIQQKVLLSSQNINVPNVNKKMKSRWLGPFPITQVDCQHNNYTLDLSSNTDLHQIHKTLHIGLLKLYRENKQPEFPQRHNSEPGPVRDNRYEFENVVNFRFHHLAREPLYQIRWKGYRPSQDQWIYSDQIDEEVKFRFWQEEDWKPTLQRRRCHRGRPEPRKRSETLSAIQAERDRVMQGMKTTSALWFEDPVADQLFNCFMKD